MEEAQKLEEEAERRKKEAEKFEEEANALEEEVEEIAALVTPKVTDIASLAVPEDLTTLLDKVGGGGWSEKLFLLNQV